MNRAAQFLFSALRHAQHASPRTRAMVARCIERYRALCAFRQQVGV